LASLALDVAPDPDRPRVTDAGQFPARRPSHSGLAPIEVVSIALDVPALVAAQWRVPRRSVDRIPVQGLALRHNDRCPIRKSLSSTWIVTRTASCR